MAFLDELSKKINGVTASAAQKTKEMSEISRLNSAMNEEEAKINNAYFQIGRLYCANHSEDYEEGFEIFINVVKESENKIKDIKAQIREIKGIVTCTKCGQDIPSNVAFCSFCGTPAPKAKAVTDPNSVICPGCRATVAGGMRFCTNCGYQLAELQVRSENPEPVPVPEKEIQQHRTPQDEAAPVSMDIDIADIIPFLDGKTGAEFADFKHMAEATCQMVTDSIDAYVNGDLDLAKSVATHDDIVDDAFSRMKNTLIKMISENNADGEYAVDLLMIAKYFERIGDHAVNIAEWVGFSVSGIHKGE